MKNTIRKIASFISAVLCIAMILSLVTIAPSFAEEYDVKKEEGAVYLSDLEWSYWYMFGPCKSTDANPQYQPSRDSEEDGKPITIARTTYEKGLRSHPDGSDGLAIFEYDISAYSNDYKYFGAVAGKDSHGGGTDIIFEVYGDDKLLDIATDQFMGDAYHFSVDISGVKILRLQTSMGENLSSDSFAWGDARLTNVKPEEQPEEVEVKDIITGSYNISSVIPEGAVILSDLEWDSWILYKSKSDVADSPYKPSVDEDEDGSPLSIAGEEFAKGLRTHVDKTYADYAEFVYDISAYDVNTFSAIVGKPTKINEGAVQFYVLADDVEIGRSPVVTSGEIYQLKTVVPAGTKKLSLRVNDGHDGISSDSCIWANPIVYKAQGTKVFMETNKLVSGEELNVTVNFPADHEIKGTDWVGIYRAEADESAISANDSIGIWAYIGSGSKSAGVAESRVVELTIDDTLAEKAPSDSEIYWPLEPGDYKLLLFYEDSYVVEDAFAFTVEEGHSAPTSEPTAEPSDDPSTDATPEPSSEATAEPTAEPSDKPAKKGCKSVVVSGAVVMVTLLGTCVIVSKKRK